MAVRAARGHGPPSSASGELRISLFDAGMTALHRAGLAGLWLTLRAIDEQPEQRGLKAELGELGSWTRDQQSVTVRWSDEERSRRFFKALIEAAFQVTDDGRIYLLGRGAPSSFEDQGITLHDALLATFLQHGRTRGADASGKPAGGIVIPGEDGDAVFQYRKVTWYAHQRAELKLRASNEIVGWLFPGGAVRHDAFKAESQLLESDGSWLALLFAPVGALYFRVQRWSAGIRPQFSLVIPEVDDLEQYARACDGLKRASIRDLIVNGSADAALRALIALEGSTVSREYRAGRCTVITYGVVPWSKQQKTRVDLFEAARVAPSGLRAYRMAHQLLPPVRVPARVTVMPAGSDADETPGRPRYETSPVSDLVAVNVVAGRPWWRGFADVVSSREAFGQLIAYQWAIGMAAGRTRATGVTRMVSDTVTSDDGPAATIVKACHAAWRRRMGRLWEQAGKNERSFNDLVARERERLRVDFTRCKNAATLRATLTDFWARADGPIKPLQEDWRSILPFLGEERWQEARDLALLALVSYAAPEEEAAGNSNDDGTNEQDRGEGK